MGPRGIEMLLDIQFLDASYLFPSRGACMASSSHTYKMPSHSPANCVHRLTPISPLQTCGIWQANATGAYLWRCFD